TPCAGHHSRRGGWLARSSVEPARTRKISRIAARPRRSFRRTRRSCFRYCSSCIPSAPAPSMTRTRRRSRRGRAWRAMAAPTTSAQSVQIGKLASSLPDGRRDSAARSASPSVVSSRGTRFLWRRMGLIARRRRSDDERLTAQDIVLYPPPWPGETQYLGTGEGGDDAHRAAAGAGTERGGG